MKLKTFFSYLPYRALFFNAMQSLSPSHCPTGVFGNPLPKFLHIELAMENVDRVIIIGDIHGCLEEFKLLLEKCSYNATSDAVVLVGDLVNKGISY